MNKWSYRDVNAIISRFYSDFTSPFRFDSTNFISGFSTSYNLSDLCQKLTPHKPLTSLYASLIPVTRCTPAIIQEFSDENSSTKKIMNKDVQNEINSSFHPEEVKKFTKNISENGDYGEYIDVKSAFQSRNQLLWIEPIDKYNIGAFIALRGSETLCKTLEKSIQDLFIGPKGKEKENLDFLTEKLIKETQKKK